MVNLNNGQPVDVASPANQAWAQKLQGNILNGHGRDHTANIFIRLPADAVKSQKIVKDLAADVTSAFKQEAERRRFKRFGVPGGIFRSVLISASGYRKLGFGDDQLTAAFADAAQPPIATSFAAGAVAAIGELNDPDLEEWEPGYQGPLDVLLILAHDDEPFLLDRVGLVLTSLPDAAIAHVEYGRALRNASGEGIEHFGYVDGRSQPLYTFEDFSLKPNGTLNMFLDGHLREADGGRTDIFDPFAPLGTVLVPDALQGHADALGSYFVFRKLEQNVRGFKLAEQLLADELGMDGSERERAGAMAVGRFENGTPVVVSQTDGLLPEKENNFTYAADPNGLKCPFQAHIRKTNPRGETGAPNERERRITRRGIPFGTRPASPQAAQPISELPSDKVGLLFMCYQSSIPKQFGFMQKLWVNNPKFLNDGTKPGPPLTGIDPVIGQGPKGGPPPAAQSWRARYGADDPGLPPPTNKASLFAGFVKMKGGEFFFAPSVPFLRDPVPKRPAVAAKPTRRKPA